MASSLSVIQNFRPDCCSAGETTRTSAPSRSSSGRALRTAAASTACGAGTGSFRSAWLPRLAVLQQQRDALAAADAERDEPELVPLALHLTQALGGDERARRRDRVAERDRAAVGVDLRRVEVELADDGERLGGERLVELDDADLV